MLIYRILADALVVFHGLLAALVVLILLAVVVGGPLGWNWVRHFWFRLAHLVVVGLIALFPLIGGICPLTTWEQWLRNRGGEETYPGSFVGHWVHELLFVEVSSRMIAVSYCVFALLVFFAFWAVPPRRPGAIKSGPPERKGEPEDVPDDSCRGGPKGGV